MFFQSSETRSYHLYIERSLENTVELLHTPVAIAHLGEYAARITDIVENQLYPADIHHGVAVAPKRLDDERVPVVALRHGEHVLLDHRFNFQTPTQHQNTRSVLGSLVDDKEVARQLNRRRHDENASFGLARRSRLDGVRKNTAYVSASYFHVLRDPVTSTEGITQHFETRPVMTLVCKPRETRKNPDTLVHEAQHIVQAIDTTVFYSGNVEDNWKRNLHGELQSYLVQARCIRAMIEIGYRHQSGDRMSYNPDGPDFLSIESKAIAIDALRAAANKDCKDPCETSEPLIKNLRLAGLDSIARSSKV